MRTRSQSRCYFIATSAKDNAVSQHFGAVARALRERGQRVIVLVHGTPRPDRDWGVPVRSWPSARPTGLRDAGFLHRLIQQYRPACLVSNFAATNWMMLLGWWNQVPCRVDWYHTLTTQLAFDGCEETLKVRLLRARKRLVYKAATHFVAPSHAAKDDCVRVFRVPPRKFEVMYNSLRDPLADRPADIAVRRSFFCAGRLEPSKGQDVLIRAVALLKRQWPDCRVEFAGNGPARQSYESLAGSLGLTDNCIFLGNLTRSDLLARAATARASIVPSRSDNCPLVVVESLAVGTPVIASRTGGLPEMVTDHVDGWLVAPDQPAALAQKLEVLLKHPHLTAAMGGEARQTFLARFEQSKVTGAQAAWLERIVGERIVERNSDCPPPDACATARMSAGKHS